MIQADRQTSLLSTLILKTKLFKEWIGMTHATAFVLLALLVPSSLGATFTVLLSDAAVSNQQSTFHQHSHDTGISNVHHSNDLTCSILLSEQLENEEDEVSLHEKTSLDYNEFIGNVDSQEMALRSQIAIQRKRYILFHCLKIPS
jgi:hypothetical protein